MKVALIIAINAFVNLIIILLIARALCSWFVRPGSSAYKYYRVLESLTEPIVAPCRKLTSRLQTGMFDFSIVLAFIIVILLRYIIIQILLVFL